MVCRIGGAKSKETRYCTVTVGFDRILQLTVLHFANMLLYGLFSCRILSNSTVTVHLASVLHHQSYILQITFSIENLVSLVLFPPGTVWIVRLPKASWPVRLGAWPDLPGRTPIVYQTRPRPLCTSNTTCLSFW